ncbi:hypothetical protein ACFQ5N_11035 [Lutibacter holmesii]|uniref:Secreted protein n=1 Tax=Lutibacter holmesii TaxID=1137985 RepID=A0ABW3WSX0_9FLAO
MKQRINKIAAVLMTFVVLLSTMSFTIHQSYCEDNLVATTLSTNVQSHQIETEKSCCSTSETCCKHKDIVFEGKNEILFYKVEKVSLKDQFFTFNLPNYRFQNFKIWLLPIIAVKEYAPPNLVEDIQTIHQVFII